MKVNLYSWVWKWHFIGGLISLPIVLLLSITGVIYLFKDNYEAEDLQSLKKVEQKQNVLDYNKQWEIAEKSWGKPLTAVVLPDEKNEATQFVSGRFSHKSIIYVDPYTGEVKGKVINNQTDMHKVRKLHGELLLGSFGTKIIELVASWMVVLIITGVYLFWPRGRGIKGLFLIRFNETKRILFRDLHAVSGFWFSALLLLILAGGLPWTDIWGGGFKWVQQKTETGFPSTWQGRSFKSTVKDEPLALKEVMDKARSLELPGEISISLPASPKSVFSISNQTTDFSSMSMYHFDQYSGKLLHHATWDDIGFLMKARLWAMAFHQGQFGLWNWLLVLFVVFGLMFMSVTALFSYLERKKRGEFGVPELARDLIIGREMVVLVLLLGVFFPLFGASVVLIFIYEKLLRLKRKASFIL